jgi:hypothetical protein
MYEMRYLTQQDMPYFRRLAEEGKAIIIRLSDQALFQIDPEDFRKPSPGVEMEQLNTVLQKQEAVLREKSEEGQRLTREIEEMVKLLEGSEPENTEQSTVGEISALPAEKMKKMIEEMIRNCMQEISEKR